MPNVQSSLIQVTAVSNDNATDAVEAKQCLQKRRKLKCPIYGKEVVQLPKHTSKVHSWSDLSSKTVVSQFGLRKSSSSMTTIKADTAQLKVVAKL